MKTSVEIRKFALEKLLQLGVTEQSARDVVFVSDAGANIKGAFDAKNFKGRPILERVSCAAHALNTVLANSVNERKRSHFLMPEAAQPILHLLKKCKRLVKHCQAPHIAKQLSKMVCTRWNTNHDMLESVNDEFDIVEGLLCQSEDLDLMSSEHEREIIKDLVRFLKPFKSATVALETSKQPSIHLVALWFRV